VTSRHRAVSTAALTALVMAAVPSLAHAAPLRPAGVAGPLGNATLSDEQTLTRWAHPYIRAKVRYEPSTDAKAFTRLHFHTEDGPLEVYLVLRSVVDDQERTWLQIRVPGRPNGQKGWIPREALGPFHTVRTHLRINRSTLRATLYRNGRRVWSTRVGVGKRSTPTPAGRFYIRERLKALGGLYGPWAFGTSAYSVLSDWPGGGVVGIHGTDQPSLIPGRPSHGCIRMPNRKIRQLVRRMPIGTPVRIV
jgi:L,D-transpeptidase-like protein